MTFDLVLNREEHSISAVLCPIVINIDLICQHPRHASKNYLKNRIFKFKCLNRDKIHMGKPVIEFVVKHAFHRLLKSSRLIHSDPINPIYHNYECIIPTKFKVGN